ncbi:MAG: SEC-C domain-containing protein, partial [Firmicutes bacterium]|nr:SEC-C domain-containing protein [Bacillota bacterium]
AAVNLYGVIESSELITVLEHYNSFDKKGKGYQRQEGSYRNTIMYTPQYLCEKVLEEVMDEIRTPVCITLDGVVAHRCFLDEYEKEAKKIIEYMKNGRSDQKLLEIFDGKDCAAYRQLRRSASAKPMYLPEREQFLKYADEDYYEITPEEEQLQAYLEQNYWKELEQAAARQERTVEEGIEELMWEFHQETTDMGWEDIHRDVQSGMHYMMNKLQEYEVTFEDVQEVNRLAQKVMPAMNSIKLWYNHGYSPKEISELISPKRSGAKKVYPNDPCPCGSGKKYKKCCGR